MLVLLFIIATANMVFPGTNAASNCSLCELEEDFTSSNGYSCFPLSNGQVACTCPDQRYMIDTPCRICERQNICGDNSDNLCAEVSTISTDVDGDSTHYFTCFCTNSVYYIGQACPSTATTMTTTWTTTMTTTTTTTITTTSRPVVATTIISRVEEYEN